MWHDVAQATTASPEQVLQEEIQARFTDFFEVYAKYPQSGGIDFENAEVKVKPPFKWGLPKNIPAGKYDVLIVHTFEEEFEDDDQHAFTLEIMVTVFATVDYRPSGAKFIKVEHHLFNVTPIDDTALDSEN